MTTANPGFHLGARRSIPDFRDYKLAEKVALQDPTTLPTAIDRRHELPPCSPDWDQGSEGSCVAFACGSAYRASRRKRHGWPIPATWAPSIHYGSLEDYTPSMQLIYRQAREKEGTQNVDAGCTIRDGVRTLHENGACAWHNYPYVAGEYAQTPPAAAVTNATHHEMAAYYALDGSLLQFKQALAADFFPVIGISVHASFWQAAQTGYVPMPSGNDPFEGGHAQKLVGYDDMRQVFISRNSWGMWGDKGYLYLPYAYVTNPSLAWDFWAISVGAL